VESDPIGLQGGFNTYGYVAGSPFGAFDSLGLFKIIYKPGTGPRDFGESRIFNERFRAYRDSLQRYADEFQRSINRDCVKDRKVLNDLFDRWVVWIDPNIFDPRTRQTATEAHTNFNDKTTQFNLGFFTQGGSPNANGSTTFAHEFRHLMDDNHRLYDPSAIILGHEHPMGQDADRWAKSCRCKD